MEYIIDTLIAFALKAKLTIYTLKLDFPFYVFEKKLDTAYDPLANCTFSKAVAPVALMQQCDTLAVCKISSRKKIETELLILLRCIYSSGRKVLRIFGSGFSTRDNGKRPARRRPKLQGERGVGLSSAVQRAPLDPGP